VVSLELGHSDNAPLPPWQPGAHIDLHLPSGLTRSYSLCGDPQDADTYRIAILRVRPGRGGSEEVHRIGHPGTRITASRPRNSFALESATSYAFVAGGIGVTPLLAMARHVAFVGRPWSFLYGGRSRGSMPFVDEIGSLPGGLVRLVPQSEAGLPNFTEAFAALPAGAAVYCCGPGPMIDAVLAAGASIRPEIPVHLERFSAPGTSGSRDKGGAFVVTLARSRVTVSVPAGISILEAVRTACPTVMSSCEEGICSACETEVLAGVPDHRDSVLTPAERAANKYMMICVSRALSTHLVLDL